MRVLSIDGGGIRGIIPALALWRLSADTGRNIFEMFDLIVGTSTGGVLALALARGKQPAQVVDLYGRRGGEIFSKPPLWLGLTDAKYGAAGIETVLRAELGEQPISAALCDVAVTSYSLAERDTVLIRSWKETTPIWEAARATSAAPSFFPSFGPRMLVDGGIWANNPARVALDLAKHRFPGERIKLLSLGTGAMPRNYRQSGGWGLLRWAGPGVSLLMDAPMHQVHRDCERELGADYARIQVQFTGGSWPMDDASKPYLERLTDAATSATEQVAQLVRQGWFA